MSEVDERVRRLILNLLHNSDDGWKDQYPSPEHYADCPGYFVAMG